MSLQMSSSIDSSSLDHAARPFTSFPEVEIRSLTDLEPSLPEVGKKSSVPALSKLRLMRVLTYIDAYPRSPHHQYSGRQLRLANSNPVPLKHDSETQHD
jgi:hypothetical protein